MGAIWKVWVRYEELKREIIGKTPEEIEELIEKYKKETALIIEDINPNYHLWKEKKNSWTER